MEFFPETHLDPSAVEAIARGLFSIARADGSVHEREAALIASFWMDSGGGAGALAGLERATAITASELSAALHGEARTLFIKTAVLLAWADGTVSPGERGVIDTYATALGIDPAGLAQLEASVKEFLLGHVSHLANTDATTAVARKLEV